MMTLGERITSKYILKKGQNLVETALSNAKYPASGSFVSVLGIPVVHILIQLGTLADALTFAVQEANAINGTPATVTGLSSVQAANDDGEFVYIAFRTNILASTTTHITVDCSGNVGSNYATILYLLEGTSRPVTQTVTVTEVIDLA